MNPTSWKRLNNASRGTRMGMDSQFCMSENSNPSVKTAKNRGHVWHDKNPSLFNGFKRLAKALSFAALHRPW